MPAPNSVEAFKFIFDATAMQQLLATNPGKVVCVVSIDEVTTIDGKKAGALKVVARGPQITTGGLEITGCPHPPCEE